MNDVLRILPFILIAVSNISWCVGTLIEIASLSIVSLYYISGKLSSSFEIKLALIRMLLYLISAISLAPLDLKEIVFSSIRQNSQILQETYQIINEAVD